MSEHILKTVADVEEKLKVAEAEVTQLKRVINDLLEMAGHPPRYAAAEPESHAASVTSMRTDQFYGRPMATVVREYLAMRKAAQMDPPASVREIYDALVKGGFKFEASSEKNAIDGLRISLAKNTAVFHKLPNGAWGLVEWYPSVKKKAARNGRDEESSNDGAPAASDDEEATPAT